MQGFRHPGENDGRRTRSGGCAPLPQKEPPIIFEQQSEKTKRTLGVCDSTDLLSSSNKPTRQGVYYLTDRRNEPQVLPDMRWVDWDNEGNRLLAATHSGILQVYDVTRKQHTLI